GITPSMESFILVGGEITKRLAFPHAWTMIHQPASSFYEAVYVQRVGKPLWVVSEDMERDVFMLATEARAYGIVDLVEVE
ncbi:hypothetical protein Pfo_000539, partial [Paulownia fortunei]